MKHLRTINILNRLIADIEANHHELQRNPLQAIEYITTRTNLLLRAVDEIQTVWGTQEKEQVEA